MAWAEQLPSGKWRAVWRNAEGRSRSKSGIKSKPAAERFAGEQESKARRGDPTDLGKMPTWGDWCPIWLGARQTEASTSKQDLLRVRKYLVPKWSAHRLNRITRTHVQAWVNELLDFQIGVDAEDEPRFLSPATIDRIYRLFSASMKAATLDEDVPLLVSPCRDIDIPDAAPGHEHFLTRLEHSMVAALMNDPWRAMVEMLGGTGMRFGEAAGLHWQRVDFDKMLIDIVETWEPVSGKIKPYPKGVARRAVPIPDWLLPTLQAQLERAGAHAGKCGVSHRPGGAACRSALVIPAPKGGPMDGANLGRRDWATAVTAAGIGHTRLHDLRHSYASWLVQDGVMLQEVQRLLGHKSILTTQRYAHLGTSQNERVLAALNSRA